MERVIASLCVDEIDSQALPVNKGLQTYKILKMGILKWGVARRHAGTLRPNTLSWVMEITNSREDRDFEKKLTCRGAECIVELLQRITEEYEDVTEEQLINIGAMAIKILYNIERKDGEEECSKIQI